MNGPARLSTGTSPARSSPSYSQSRPVSKLLHRPIESTARDTTIWAQMAKSLVRSFALNFDPEGVERVELVESRLGAHPIGILRGLDRLEQELDLLRRELQRPEHDFLDLLVPIDRLPDHVIGVGHDLRPRRPEQLLRA